MDDGIAAGLWEGKANTHPEEVFIQVTSKYSHFRYVRELMKQLLSGKLIPLGLGLHRGLNAGF